MANQILMLDCEQAFLKILEAQALSGDVCEIGTGKGTSTSILASGRRTVFSIDPMPMEHTWRRTHERATNIIYVRDYSTRFLDMATDSMFALIFIDGDHSKESVEQDIIASIPHLKAGGFIAFHDYGDKSHPFSVRDEEIKDWEIDRYPGVKEAVDAVLPKDAFSLYGHVGSLICFFRKEINNEK